MPPTKSKPSQQAGYTVLARRYRSRDFDELIGQEPIARTLQNAIKTNRTAHAYLFSGTRGVGKTSMARIFARALNATDDLKEKDAVAEAILRGDDLDVIEIDAASNRGVQDARDLIAGAGLSPARSPFKIYIIDEVHMLTKEAFNTLLKTMEEPPAHVKFILCTTEPQKVPATIQSRCQRFDFRAIPSAKIAQQLRTILKQEKLEADDEVVAQVARLGNGSMRDALSIMDRLLAGGEQKLTLELLEEMLGLPEHGLVEGLVDAFVAEDAATALARGAELLARGATVEQAMEMLTDHLRTLMIIAACGADADILDVSDDRRKVAAAQAQNFDAPALVHMIALCDAAARNAHGSAAGRALFDAVLVRLCMSKRFADVTALLSGKLASSVVTASASADSKKKAGASLSVQAPGAGEPAARVAVTEVKPDATRQAVPEIEVGAGSNEELWSRVLQVAAASVPDRMKTQHLVFESFDGSTLRLSLDDAGADVAGFLKGDVDWLANLVQRATGRNVRVELDTSRIEQVRRAAPKPAADSSEVRKLPLVEKALDLFDAQIVSVEADQQD